MTWLQLTPFIKSVIIYFVVREFDFFNSNVLSTVLKCAPIICLMAFIFFMGFKFTNEFRYHQLILGGLVFSAVGDAFLDYQKGILFQYGMMAFAVAQIFYISAFGWKPLKFLIGLAFYAFGGSGKKVYLWVISFIDNFIDFYLSRCFDVQEFQRYFNRWCSYLLYTFANDGLAINCSSTKQPKSSKATRCDRRTFLRRIRCYSGV